MSYETLYGMLPGYVGIANLAERAQEINLAFAQGQIASDEQAALLEDLVRTQVIVDEAQNMNDMELNSIMTRVGNNTKIIFCGDFRQTDLNKRNDLSGLKKFMAIANHMPTFRHVEFEVDDIVRSSLVKEYIVARMMYEDILVAS